MCLGAPEGNPIIFHAPFSELYSRYDDILAMYRPLDENDSIHPVRHLLRLLIWLLDNMFLVSFNSAWALFPKDTAVITRYGDCEYLSKVTETRYEWQDGQQTLRIFVRVLKFDNRGLRWGNHELRIDAFDGKRGITELASYPLGLHKAPADVQSRLTARGGQLLDLFQGLTIGKYSCIALRKSGTTYEPHKADRRVVIDVFGYAAQRRAPRAREANDAQSEKPQLLVGEKENGNDSLGHRFTTEATPFATIITDAKRPSPAAQKENTRAMLETEKPELMYMWPLMGGYVLESKVRTNFFVKRIDPILSGGLIASVSMPSKLASVLRTLDDPPRLVRSSTAVPRPAIPGPAVPEK
jgi:hypothetical protein